MDIKATQQQILDELSLGMNVQFKTGSSQIESIFQGQLDNVAYMMNISPELTLDLTGYADRRGDSGYNQALSEQRLVEVKNYIESQGVRNSVYKGKLMMPQLYSMKHRMLKVTFLIAA